MELHRRLFLKIGGASTMLPASKAKALVHSAAESVAPKAFPLAIRNAVKDLAHRYDIFTSPQNLFPSQADDTQDLFKHLEEQMRAFCSAMQEKQKSIALLKDYLNPDQIQQLETYVHLQDSYRQETKQTHIHSAAQIFYQLLTEPCHDNEERLAKLFPYIDSDAGKYDFTLEEKCISVKSALGFHYGLSANSVINETLKKLQPYLHLEQLQGEDLATTLESRFAISLESALRIYSGNFKSNERFHLLFEKCRDLVKRSEQFEYNIEQNYGGTSDELLRIFTPEPGALTELVGWTNGRESSRLHFHCNLMQHPDAVPSIVEQCLKNIAAAYRRRPEAKNIDAELLSAFQKQLPVFLEEHIPELMGHYFPKYIQRQQAHNKPQETCKPEKIAPNIRWPGLEAPGNDIY